MTTLPTEAPSEAARDFDPVVVVAAWGLVTLLALLARVSLAGVFALAFATRSLLMPRRASQLQRRLAGRQLDASAGFPLPR